MLMEHLYSYMEYDMMNVLMIIGDPYLLNYMLL
jgi:hypothetical protein